MPRARESLAQNLSLILHYLPSKEFTPTPSTKKLITTVMAKIKVTSEGMSQMVVKVVFINIVDSPIEIMFSQIPIKHLPVARLVGSRALDQMIVKFQCFLHFTL